MENGISLYLGLGIPPDLSATSIVQAAKNQLHHLFITLPDYDCDLGDIKDELSVVLKTARENNMDIVANLTRKTMSQLALDDCSPTRFRMWGIKSLRFGEGFSPAEIAAFSQNRQGVRTVLNASTITPKILAALMELKANFAQIDALHNFYPRPGTGLSEDFLVSKNMLLHKVGIQVGAFVANGNREYGFFRAGHPTLENHRQETVSLSCRHLVALGVDKVFLGDIPPVREELQLVSQLSDQAVTLRAKWLTQVPQERELLQHVFTARQDAAQMVVRAKEGYELLQGNIPPDNTSIRPLGAITIDNEKNRPYMGEIQICRQPQCADAGINVAAQIDEAELNLIEYISPGRKFSFLFHE
ncbi:hypothetical protein SAMN05216582_106112 [Selenomonas ruminantium]|uniref:Outer surface protein n=1 Tax=Selenomonas ruminantium TaxID=971 RepID=A0A1M6T6N6_SELRU|nr:MupG family TIM beta-alpha barrel fold protein [Selenomonas ruminantium]SHK52556.1 hypothetical protein SAMN05216582_106112 [Selenomonas ruminantium]